MPTSVFIASERRLVDFGSWLTAHGSDEIAISVITAAELLHGCERAMDSGTRARRAAFVEHILDSLPVLPYTLGSARHHARIWARLGRRGSTIGPHDLIIAATALDSGYSLATLNRRDFERIPDLQLAPLPE